MSTTLAKAYAPQEVEERWAREWIQLGVSTADPSAPGPGYSIVIPPPNITGQLHLGHALNNTLQDVLIRYKRMDGHNTLWVPGTDHASIATQNVVERQLAQQGLDRHGIGREKFLERTFAWKSEVGPYIVSQLKRLGATCDWTRERFTMDEGLSRAVREVFVRLFEDGLIYRGRRLINWCCRCGTALSDIEVEHEDVKGHLWHLRYPLADGSGALVVATTRPETMLGDTAVAVHPEDERYAGLVGRRVKLPLTDREIGIIADEHVDREFGSGVVKITPAHDFNDFEIGRRHGLDMISVIAEDGMMTAAAGAYAGTDRALARKHVVEQLEADGLLEKVEPHALAVGHCYRCRAVVEPLLSTQWFVRTQPLAEPAIAAVRDGRTRFYPEHWSKTYFAWMENIRDWCVSRQLWWGHRIPAWYCDGCPADAGTGPEGARAGEEGCKVIVSREDPPHCPSCGGTLRQDEDVLDTWFSSGLWPFSTMGWPEKTPELAKYYPTDVLVTGFDIIFFWVARMMMFGLRFTGEVPFRDVYVHGLVRDEYGDKMSKTKGNVKDPLELLATYGTDALRFTLVAQSAMGRDIRLSVDRIDGNRSFANKIWNAARFVLMNAGDGKIDLADGMTGGTDADRWIRARLARCIDEVRTALDGYRFNDAAAALYRFFWNELCDWYLELAKPSLGSDGPERAKTVATLVAVLESALRMLHPLMPFITEELWHALPGVDAGRSTLLLAQYPASASIECDEAAEARVERLIAAVRALRNLRAEMSLPPSREIDLLVAPLDAAAAADLPALTCAIRTLARVGRLEVLSDGARPGGAALAVAGSFELYVPLAGLIDVAAERERLEREIERVVKELAGARKKLDNQDFVQRAPDEIVAKETAKAAELAGKEDLLRRGLERLREVAR
ncbi:MAG: valine--tRNA ligase [Deltaproteobacteria bacterium]|nr:valine--tRNA ligase [Deltaproteobacteria bacterium]